MKRLGKTFIIQHLSPLMEKTGQGEARRYQVRLSFEQPKDRILFRPAIRLPEDGGKELYIIPTVPAYITKRGTAEVK